MTKLDFVCKKCQQNFVCDVGDISFPIESERPHFQKNIVCLTCGIRSMDDVKLTELGQTQLSLVFMSKL